MSRSRSVDSPEIALLESATQLLAKASEPARTLGPLVTMIKEQMRTDVCSLYLQSGADLVLVASDGLAPGAIGQVRMQHEEGLTGLVAEVRAPVSVAEASRHPRFRYFPETGEERYHSFLGVPLLRRGEVEGVLVVQTRVARDFHRDEVRTLGAVAAQLAAFLAGAAPSEPIRNRAESALPMFPSVGALVRTPEETAECLRARPPVLVAPSDLGADRLRAVAEAAPGIVVLVPCELTEVEMLAGTLRQVALRSPLRLVPAGVLDPGDLAIARKAVLRNAGSGVDLGLGVTIDSAASAISIRSMAAQADMFYFDTTTLAESATAGRLGDPLLPAVLRMIARALHGARESGRPTFVGGALAQQPEGWVAAAGLGADVLVVPATDVVQALKFGLVLAPGGAPQAARRALRSRTSAAARAVLIAAQRQA